MHTDSCKFDEAIWKKYVKRGFCAGTGDPESQVCVEVALSIACGYTPTDQPECALPASRRFAIALNDKNWSSPQARSKGMAALALAQLGTAHLDGREFSKRVAEATIRQIIPIALRAVAKRLPAHAKALRAAAARCVKEGTRESALDARIAAADAYAAADAAAYAAAAYAAAYAAAADDAAAAYAAAYADAADDAAAAYARDRVLSIAADIAAKALNDMKTEIA